MALPARDSELIQIMDAAWADAARRAGSHLACRPGCTQCCHGAFAINALDAARLRAGMDELRAKDPAKAAMVTQRALAWIEQWRAAFPGDSETGTLGSSEADEEGFEEFANDAACPALDPATGRCDVYAWRPMTCRVFGPPVRQESGALACCELCFTSASDEETAACEMPVPHDLEMQIVNELGDDAETVVAYALVKPASASGR
ncbi:YkgJ family cysteine cluster protein [Occallatibacter riparius]|uniref:YkgJ family cysteine cluster protein n=1 Tax=Occallatibacter riparius TaxID=1002689 RepID=A0A9J7BSJ3_9BACT|nr:YkgJ family cysteine cluster protein [Occallatibacter riparius]UWZ84730.1 YkgJ family cysteine cluster protein [Occallatibacter riparius]